ncbi:Glyoxalase-like domain-containing protein [Soonwooa buanensis]|uniref:Glyoxalase-like domain-containing protein n=1 Tax=Soonwooa buanensis TaxID=619805 RepID=A0A1T5GKV5_9FLAO|nr:VOC family protein [Soonwooa buanensis]SKC09001.1 Glyoxalase-like domain-containing protein [Soonwooa buanensis]
MLQAIIPKIPFIEKEKTLDFYLKQLGFNLISDYGDYMILEKDNLEIHFFSYQSLEKEKSDFMLYIRVTDIETFYQTLIKNNVKIHPNGALERKPWNQTEFSIIDPNGTLLTFGENLK